MTRPCVSGDVYKRQVPGFDQLVGAVTRLTGLAVNQRVVEGGDVARCDPDPGIHQNGGVKPDVVGRFLHKLLPPGAFHIVFQLNAERTIVPGVRKSAVDFASGENKASAFAESYNFVHCLICVEHVNKASDFQN